MNPKEKPLKIYFLSDLHLGARYNHRIRERELQVVRFLDSIKEEATALYLLGDVLDFWYEYKEVVPRGFTRFFGKIAEFTDRGIPVHWFTGNHDLWIFDYLPSELGIIVHRDTYRCSLGGKQFLMAHGDNLDNSSRSFRFMRAIFTSPLCQRLFSMIHPRWALGFAHRWSSHSRAAHERDPEVYLGEENEYLVRYAKKELKKDPNIDFFLFGHRHLLLDLLIAKNSRVIILGDWITHNSYACFDGEQLYIDQFEV